MSSGCDPGPAATADAFTEQQRLWRSGWRRYVFPSIWLIYLLQTASGVANHAAGWVAAVGYAIVLAFAFCYLAALPAGWSGEGRRFWWLYGAMFVLLALELPIAHQDALVFCVYLAVLTVASRSRWTVPIIVGLIALNLFAPVVIHSWGGEVDWQQGLTILLVAFAMYGFFAIIHSNIQLAAARAEVARLAAENERSRIARDLHDLLGHSLTTITVKAALARRLAERDPQRAAAEIAEVEELGRSSLSDVRAAVSGYREVTLIGEIASAREVLRAAGVQADLPRAVDVVAPVWHELFGWVVREGVTNVIRHARATRCTITLGPTWISIVDDGRGGAPGSGHGLTGLRERVAAAGGTLTSQGGATGWRLRADVTARPPAEAPREVDEPTLRA
jgi:two-component system, NarL family, sensor histidine kinase DesK